MKEEVRMHGRDTSVTVRTAGPADCAVICAHNQALARETEGRDLDPATVRRGTMAVLRDPAKGRYLLAESEGSAVGQCMVTYEWSDWRNGTFWWIQSVYVTPAWRRRTVFSCIYRSLFDEAKTRSDVVGIRLYVDRENHPARRAYAASGMQEGRYVLYDLDFTDHACRQPEP